MAGKNRGSKPQRPAGTLREVRAPVNFDRETPKFCLHHVRAGFDVHALDADGQAAVAKTLQKLATLTWTDIKLAHYKGNGTEYIGAAQIRAPIPARFQDQPRFMMFRYSAKLPMGGVRIDDVFHVLWFERHYGELYDHG